MNGGDKLVKGVNVTIDNEATVESTVNILVSDVVVTEDGSCVVVTAGIDSITVSVSSTVSVLNVLIVVGRVLLADCISDCTEEDGVTMVVKMVVEVTNKESVGDSVKLTTGIKLLIALGIFIDVTSVLSTVEVTNNVSVVSKLLRILLDIISVDCITVGTIALDVVDEGVTIVDKLSTVTSADSVNSTVEDVIG